jgi:hypothetical protein
VGALGEGIKTWGSDPTNIAMLAGTSERIPGGGFGPGSLPEGLRPGDVPLVPEPVRTAPGEYRPGFNAQGGVVSRAGVPKLQGPGLRPGGGLSSIHPDYVRPGTVAAEVPPPMVPAIEVAPPADAPPPAADPNTMTSSGRTIGEIQADPFNGRTVFPDAGLATQGSRFTFRPAPENFTPTEARPASPGEGTAPVLEPAGQSAPVRTPATEPVPEPASLRPLTRWGNAVSPSAEEAGPPPMLHPKNPSDFTITKVYVDPLKPKKGMAYQVAEQTYDLAGRRGQVENIGREFGTEAEAQQFVSQRTGASVEAVQSTRSTTPATEPVPEPATDRPVPEPAPTGEGQATTPTAAKPGIATRVVKGVGKSLIQHPVRTAAGVAAGVFSANEALHRRGLAGAPAGTTPPSGTTRGQTTTQTLDPMEQARRSGVPSSAKRGALASMPGVDVVGEGKEVWGAIDEHGNFVLFPDGMTPDAMKARMQQIADAGGSPVPTPAAAPPSPPASSGPAASPPASPSPPVNTPIAPLATGAAAAEDAQPSSGTPLITKDGVDTGLVLNNDGTVTQKSGGSSKGYYDSNGDWHWYNDYSKGSSSGSSSHKTYGSSGSSRSSSKKKKGSSSSQFGDGFPFNRPNSPMRDFILKAIQESMAGSHSKKR